MLSWYENDKLIGLVVTHVDDFIYCGTTKWNDKVIGKIKSKFNISLESEGKFKFLGLNVEQSEKGICIDQGLYIESVKEISLSAERKKNTREELTREERNN